MKRIIKKSNFLNSNNLNNLEDVKSLTIYYLPKNYELVLKGYKNLEKIYISNLRDNNIILENLENLSLIEILDCKITLILNNNLNKLDLVDIISYTKDLNIIDNFHYLQNIKDFKINTSENLFLNDKFSNISELNSVSSKVTFILDCYPNLKEIIFEECNIYGKSKFPLLKDLSIYNFHSKLNSDFIFLDSELESLTDFVFINEKGLKDGKIKSSYIFKNLKFMKVEGDIKEIDFFIHNSSKILEEFDLDSSIKVSHSLYYIIPEDVRDDYEIII